ncbi:MAG: hypothetical protein N3I35_03070 [Clostridia bacterium]|nr:hypothetical protein [Clostridia bacterium]
MDIRFERMTAEYRKEVMGIFNHYVENSFSVYPENVLPYELYGMFLYL